MPPANKQAVDRATPWRTFPGLRVREVWYRPGAVQHRHRHAECSLSLVVAGEFEETSSIATYRAAAGSLVVKPADCLHANCYGPRGARVVQVTLSGDGELCRAARWRYEWREVPQLAGAILRLAAEGPNPEATEATLWEMLAGVFAPDEAAAGAPPAWWSEAVDLLNASAEQSISVAALARRLGVHPVHLARVCRRQLGCTVLQYIRRRRVLSAWRSCQRADSTLAAIASRTGFADQAHMTRAFREVLGISPARLRRIAIG